MIKVTYRKNIVTGDKKDSSYVEEQILTSPEQALAFRQHLAEITDLFPAKDPVTDELCFVTDVNQLVMEKENA